MSTRTNDERNSQTSDAERAVRAIRATDRPVVVLTGATGGIGGQIARDLSRDRLVVAVGRDRERLAALEREAEGVVGLPADLSRLEDIEGTFSRLPRVDALVHAAAIAPRATLEDARVPEWRAMLETNVVAPAELTRVLLPRLREATAAEEPATVVFLGSGASRAVNPYNVAYAASKHALQAVADGFRQEVAGEGIRVATVAPGPTDTTMVQWDDAYPAAGPERLIRPTTVARSVRHVLDAPADTQITEVWVRPRVEAK